MLTHTLPIWKLQIVSWALAILLVVVASEVAWADDAKSKSGVQPQVISLPSGPGSLEGLGASFEPNLNTGTAGYPVKLEVPPGRAGFQPDVTLNYDGGNANGAWGIGWKLNLESICRHTDEGLPSYDDSQDRFVYSNGEKLVALSNGDHRFENESSFMRFRRGENGGWQAWMPDGTRLLLGTSEESREINSYGIFCWKVSQRIDTHDNRIDYTYLRDGSYLYLREIRYNQSETGGYNAVLINYSPRSDRFVDRRSRAPVSIGLRADEIQMWAQGRFVRSYRFGYESALSAVQRTKTANTDGEVDHSLLTTITQAGDDGVSTLPPTTFSYTQFDPSSYRVVSMQTPPPIGLTNPDADLVDINADGLPDVVWTPSDGHRYYLNAGDGKWQAQAIYPSQSPTARLSSPNARMADINGDGQVDLVIKAGSTAGSPFYYYARKPGKQWEAGDRIDFNLTPSFAVDDPNVRLLDINNDKRVDFMLTSNERYYVWLAHNDNTWSNSADFVVASKAVGSPLTFSNPRFKLGDMTGDRLQDLVFVRNGLVVYFPSHGNANYGEAVTMGNPPFNLSSTQDVQIQLGDLNNDGLDDLILAGNRTVRYWLNLGNNRFSTPIDLTGTPAYNQSDTALRLADIDGDGATELLFSRYPANSSEIMQYVDFFIGPQPYLLRRIDNGLGRRIQIEYKSSTEYYIADQSAGKPWATTLPFPVQVVSRVTVQDANSGDNYIIDYSYRDGYYDGVQKEFRGFARSEEIEHGDSSAPTTVTRYRYDTGNEQESRKGLVLEKEILAVGGACAKNYSGCYQREVNQLASRLLFDEGEKRRVAHSYVAQTDTFLHETQANAVQLRKSFAIDVYGNPTQEFNHGQVCGSEPTLDLTCGDDEVLKYTDYALNLDRWIVNRPSSIRQTDAAGNFVSEMRMYYDGEPFVGLAQGQVAQGDLTRQEENLGPLGNQRWITSKRQQVDAWGNVIAMLDANGNRTTVEYDGHTHTFPVTERIHLGEGRSLSYAATYHFGFGKVSGAVDFNGNAYHFAYDSFGRITKLVKPGDKLVLPTQEFVYSLGSPRSSITTHQREQSGTENVLTSVVYFDGLGRKLQTRREAEHNQVIVEAAMSFNARQSEEDGWLPYFATSFDYAAPDLAQAHTSKLYDVMGRVVHATNPDASFTSVLYQPLTKIQFDEEDNHTGSPHHNTPKTLFFDGLERLVAVQEQNIVNGQLEKYDTRYAYDRLGNLTRITDALGNLKIMQYDALSRKTFMDDPDRGEMRYLYDDNGNLIQTTDAKGQVIRSSYDAANRKLSEQWQQADGSFKTVFTWHYDADLSPLHPDAQNTLGQVAYVEDTEGALFFSYDARSNVVGRIRSFAREGWSFVTRSQYDAQDRVSKLTYPDGFTVSYEYNNQGLLERIPGFVEQVEYNAASQRTTIGYANSTQTTYGYDARQRLTNLRTTAGQRLLQSLAYQFDLNSNIIAITDARNDKVPANDQSQTFQYDPLYRLTQSSGSYGQINHAYNAIGNMIRQNSIGSANIPTDERLNLGEMKYGENGAGPHALTSTAKENYPYDANGNRLGKNGTLYIWNPRDWLTSVSDGDTTSTYEYDFSGQRLRQSVRQGSLVTTTLYADQVVEVRGNQLVRYLFDDQKRTAEMTLAFEPAKLLKGFGDSVAESSTPPATTRWYVSDHLGGTSLLVDGSAQVVSEVAYYPFGLTRYESNGGMAKYRFTGKELDQSGLYYFEARFFDPITGNFISVDPFVAEQPDKNFTNSQSHQLYAYTVNNPLRYVDPTGHWLETPWDVANVVTGASSLAFNLSTGNFLGAAVDVVGLTIDIVATATPGVPAGASELINASRLARYAVHETKGAQAIKSLAEIYTRNPASQRMMLGVWGGAKDYIKAAKTSGATYFNTDRYWKVGKSFFDKVGSGKAWKVNEKVLENQVAKGKIFELNGMTVQAAKARGSEKMLTRELNHLESKGVSIKSLE